MDLKKLDTDALVKSIQHIHDIFAREMKQQCVNAVDDILGAAEVLKTLPNRAIDLISEAAAVFTSTYTAEHPTYIQNLELALGEDRQDGAYSRRTAIFSGWDDNTLRTRIPPGKYRAVLMFLPAREGE